MNVPSTFIKFLFKLKKGRNKYSKISSEIYYSFFHNLFLKILGKNFKSIFYNREIAT